MWAPPVSEQFFPRTSRRKVLGSISGRACRPSHPEFSVFFSETHVNTGKDPLDRSAERAPQAPRAGNWTYNKHLLHHLDVEICLQYIGHQNGADSHRELLTNTLQINTFRCKKLVTIVSG